MGEICNQGKYRYTFGIAFFYFFYVLMSIETPRNLMQPEERDLYMQATTKQLGMLAKQVVEGQNIHNHQIGDHEKKNYTDLEKKQRREIDRWFGFDNQEWKKIWNPKDPQYVIRASQREERQTLFDQPLIDEKTGTIREHMKDDMLLFLANIALGKGGDAWIASVSEQMFMKIMQAKDRYVAMMSARDENFAKAYQEYQNNSQHNKIMHIQQSFDDRKQQLVESLQTDIQNTTWLEASLASRYQSRPCERSRRGVTLCSQTARLNAERFGIRFQRGDAFEASLNSLVDKKNYRGCLPLGREHERPQDSWSNIDFSQSFLSSGANVLDLYVGRYPPQVSSRRGHRACAIKIEGNRYVLDPYRKVMKEGRMQLTQDPIPLAIYQRFHPILKAYAYASPDLT
ncbi:MAG: hypothetical protein NZL83_00075 [Candidatus Absconditabacterales bacterium]|nr:hypothetical protein [Candidatus Absconditabacterales bacterium]